MTLQEFKIWFEGFLQALPKKPSQDQWDLIKNKFSSINTEENKISDQS